MMMMQLIYSTVKIVKNNDRVVVFLIVDKSKARLRTFFLSFVITAAALSSS